MKIVNHRNTTYGWSLDYPAGWEDVSELFEAPLAVCEPARSDGIFRANANVVMQAVGDGDDMATYVSSQAEALLSNLGQAILVDSGNQDLVVAHIHDGLRLTLWQRHLKQGPTVAVLSLTVESIEFGSRFDELDEIASSLRFSDV